MLSYNETKEIIELILATPTDVVRDYIHVVLKSKNVDESKLYKGIVTHAPAMNLTSEQWFDMLSKFPNRLLRSQLPVERILSETQISKLPPVTG